MIAYYCLLAGVVLGWLIGHAHGLDVADIHARKLRDWRVERRITPNRRRS